MGEEGKPAGVYSDLEDEVIKSELDHLGLAAGDQKLGLALSGGGIRSASFALGVLQALHDARVFEKFHFLSTVSGGGYIGTALTYFRNLFGPRQHYGLDWFPFGFQTTDGVQPGQTVGARVPVPAGAMFANHRSRQIVNFIRQHASFLTPSRQLNTSALMAGVFRGLVTTAIPYFLILAGLLGVLIAAGLFRGDGTAWYLVPVGHEQAMPNGDANAQGTSSVDRPVAASSCPPDPCAEPKPKPPSFFLATWPISIAGWLFGIMVLVALISSMTAGITHSSKAFEWLFNLRPARDLGANLGYRILIWLYGWGGHLLVAIAISIGISTLPWVHRYLNFLLQGSGNAEFPATFAALFSTIAGAAGLLSSVRGILGGKPTKPSSLRSLGLVLAGIAFVYGVLLLAYGVAFELLVGSRAATLADEGIEALGVPLTQWTGAALPVLTIAIGFFMATLVKVNHAAQHRLYRDRLMEVFCAEEDSLESGLWNPATTAQTNAGWVRNMRNPKTPYHFVNTCLVTTDSNDRKFRGRGGDNFILSPLYCGSYATGWVETAVAMPTLSIATAAAISGAALNAHTGVHGHGLLRQKAYAALLSFTGLQLGFWARNPLCYVNTTRAGLTQGKIKSIISWGWSKLKTLVSSARPTYEGLPLFTFPNLIKPGLSTLTGIGLHEMGDYVQLSDGGHFENLAIYELVRRKVKLLWVSDAGQDTGFSFEDLSIAIERVRVDFGVNIRFYDEDYDLTHLQPKSAVTASQASKNFADQYKLAKRGYAIGTIEYPPETNPDGTCRGPEETNGTIVYVKSTLTRYLPGDIYGYKARNDDFPHQTTLDQFFDEEQFEAYRELGYRLATRLFRDIKDARKVADAGSRVVPAPLEKVATLLGL